MVSFQDYSASSKLLVCSLISWPSYMKCHFLFCYWACTFIVYVLNPGTLLQTNTPLSASGTLLFKLDLHPSVARIIGAACLPWTSSQWTLQRAAPTFSAVLSLTQSKLTANDFCSLSTCRGTAAPWMTSAACQAVPAGRRMKAVLLPTVVLAVCHSWLRDISFLCHALSGEKGKSEQGQENNTQPTKRQQIQDD